MSYLEGDSLLKEIEKSLESHGKAKDNLLYDDDEDDEDDVRMSSVLDERLGIKQRASGVREGIEELPRQPIDYKVDFEGINKKRMGPGKHLQPLEIGSSDPDEAGDESDIVLNQNSGSHTTNTAKNRSSLLVKGPISNTGGIIDTSKESGSGGKGSLVKSRTGKRYDTNVKSTGS
jgi:hypothetical protein